MPHSIDPTPFITITPRGHRPRLGVKLARVPLGGARVTAATAGRLTAWMAQLGKSRGITLDLLATFADENGFNDFATGYTCRDKQQAGKSTTTPPARLSMPRPHSATVARSVKPKPVRSK